MKHDVLSNGKETMFVLPAAINKVFINNSYRLFVKVYIICQIRLYH